MWRYQVQPLVSPVQLKMPARWDPGICQWNLLVLATFPYFPHPQQSFLIPGKFIPGVVDPVRNKSQVCWETARGEELIREKGQHHFSLISPGHCSPSGYYSMGKWLLQEGKRSEDPWSFGWTQPSIFSKCFWSWQMGLGWMVHCSSFYHLYRWNCCRLSLFRFVFLSHRSS